MGLTGIQSKRQNIYSKTKKKHGMVSERDDVTELFVPRFEEGRRKRKDGSGRG